MFFDVLKPWTIIRPESCAEAAHTLARALGALRRRLSPEQHMPGIIGANDEQQDDFIIVINCDEGSKKRCYSWRAGESRVEIYGHAPVSLIAAAADFLAALGVQGDADGGLQLPQPDDSGLYKLHKNHAYNAG